ncbi:MAG TPA: TonB family protein [Alphaproteobacteria bacterium]|nr:TonB family protein [Alphaproteobacteria bacterium]
MNLVAAGTATEAAARALAAGAQHLVLPSGDAHRIRRRAAAISAALLLHASLLAFLLLEPEKDEPPPPIAVELVAAPPPQPAAPPQGPAASQPPATPAASAAARASGGALEREVGQPPDVPAPTRPETVPEPAPSKARPEPAPPAAGKAAAALPLPPEAKPSTAQPAPAAARTAAGPPQPPARSRVESDSVGKGGGDRYLNTVRDEIERNRVYPPAARTLGLAGTAQYAMLVDRRGRLMRVRLLHSSGADILDKAGIETIERSAPFQPLPPEIIGEVVDLVVTLHLAP